MPSTEYFGYLLTNVGPLTTTFTAAPSCETQNLALAEQVSGFESTYDVYWRSECDFPSIADDCMPSASQFNALYQSHRSGDLTYPGWAVYHSPASICPKDWETVGIASMSSGGSASKSGIFTTSARPDADESEGFAYPLELTDWYLGALEEGEKLVWCCPSDHTVQTNGLCISTVGPWDSKEYDQFTTVCNYGNLNTEVITVTSYDGTTWDPPLLSYAGDELDFTTFKETLVPTQTSGDYAVVHSVAAIALISKDDDDKGEDGDDNNNDDDDDDDNENNDEENSDNSNEDDNGTARSPRALAFLPLMLIGLGFLGGMGVLMPW